MLIAKYSRLFLKFKKIYFAKEISEYNADIIKYIQYNGLNNGPYEYFYTSKIDLNNSEQIIRSSIRKNYLHRINQAKKKYNIITSYINKTSDHDIDLFIKIYNGISKEKGYPPIVKEDLWSIRNNIVISYAYYESNLLCGHLYIHDKERFRQLNSFIIKEFKNRKLSKISSIGNKYLNYNDIFYAKENSFDIFDFGGLFNLDSKTKGITIFKLGFSNNFERSTNFTIANSLKGVIILFLYRYFNYETIIRLFFTTKFIFLSFFDEIIFRLFDLSNVNKIKYIFNAVFIEYYNFFSLFNYLKITNNDKVLLLSTQTGIPIILLKSLKYDYLDVITNNSIIFKFFKNYKSINILYKIKFFNKLDDNVNLDSYDYFLINQKDIKIEELRILIEKITSEKSNNIKFSIVYFNPIYNHIFEEFNLFLIKDIRSALNSRIHIYSNIR